MANVSSSNSQAVRVPKLRFPGFEGKWEPHKLSDIANYVRTRNQASKSQFVSTENMKQNCSGVEPYTEDDIVEGITFDKGDILIANIRPYLKKAWLASFSGICSTDVLAIHPMNIDSAFLYSAISRDSFFTYVMSGVKGSKMPRGDKNHIMDFPLAVPVIEEQEKIAGFIQFLSKRIEKQHQLIELLKSYKRGVSEAVFSGKLNLICDTGIQWKKHKLGALGYFYNGLSGKTKDDFGSGNSEFITYMNVYKNVIADEQFLEDVNVPLDEKQNTVHYGDILFTQSSETLEEVGYSSVWLSAKAPYLNSFCFGFRFNTSSMTDPYFIAHYFRSSTIRNAIMREGQGATRVNLSSERLKNIVVSLPPLSMQKKIGTILNNLQIQINRNTVILDRLCDYKDGLLQRLFI